MSDADYPITAEREGVGALHDAARRGIRAADSADVGARDYVPICLALRDADGRVLGALLGATMWGWLMIDSL